MVRDSLDAFVRLDVDAAREVCLRDDIVDELNRQLISDLYDLVQANPTDIEPAFHFYSASRHVERIADHATNISEDVIYLVDGEIARHRHDGIPLNCSARRAIRRRYRRPSREALRLSLDDPARPRTDGAQPWPKLAS